MKLYPDRLSNKISFIFLSIQLLVFSAIILHWHYVLQPVLYEEESSKASILLQSYLPEIERRVAQGDRQGLIVLARRVLALEDSLLKVPLVLSVDIELNNGLRVHQGQTRELPHEPITITNVLQLPEQGAIVGNIRLVYNCERYHHLVSQTRFRLLWSLLLVLLVLIAIQRVFFNMMRPLGRLSQRLQHIDLDNVESLFQEANSPGDKKSSYDSYEIKQLWSALAQLLGRLRDREQQLQQQFASTADAMREKFEAMELSRIKDQFLANMSHELRTPLNAILGYSEMLRDDALKAGRMDEERDLSKIYCSGKKLLDVINDILELSKLESGNIKIEQSCFDVSTMLLELEAMAQPLAKASGNDFDVTVSDNLGNMQADMGRLRQVLLKLLDNAFKFTHDGRVSLQAGRIEQNGEEWVVFTVIDTGIGLSAEQIQDLFQAFSQLDPSSTRKYEGTGLGLVICRKLSRLMGGEISVSSDEGRGSVFRLGLPVRGVGTGISCAEAQRRAG